MTRVLARVEALFRRLALWILSRRPVELHLTLGCPRCGAFSHLDVNISPLLEQTARLGAARAMTKAPILPDAKSVPPTEVQ